MRSTISRSVCILFLSTIALHCKSQQVNGEKATGVEMCGSLANKYGPYEYRPDRYRPAPLDRVPQSEKLRIVETNHFSPLVAALIKGQSTPLPGGDLDYLLLEFPNHHKALASLLKVARAGIPEKTVGLPLPAECYFDRALRFASDDTVARLLYAQFLIYKARLDDANAQIGIAVTQAGDNPLTHYNCGLLYFEAKNFEAALKQAYLVRTFGFDTTPLEQKLRAAGQWREATPEGQKPNN